jgi:nucleoside-diphosphate-sugar epimerase
MSDCKRILIVGCGQLGLPLARLLAVRHTVWGLCRSARTDQQNVRFIQADLGRPESLNGVPAVDIVVYCVSPSQRDEAGYRTIYVDGLRQLWHALDPDTPPTHLFYVSSSSVYGQRMHDWVDEDSATEPESYAGRVILQGESLARALCPGTTVIRFSGIYGGTRSRLIDLVQSRQAQLKDSPHYSNRIHEEDCIGFLQHLVEQACQGASLESCYLASDSLPVEQNEVLGFLAQRLGVELETGAAPLMREGVGSKRCRNAKMLSTGYRLRYPSFQEGYQAMLDARLGSDPAPSTAANPDLNP